MEGKSTTAFLFFVISATYKIGGETYEKRYLD